jgi:hypothetical protein
MKQSGRRKSCLHGLLEAMKTMVKLFLCDRVTLSGYPFPPSLRSSGFILSVSDGLKWWSWRLMPRLINTFSFSVFFCSLCLRSGDKSKAGNAGFLLSPLLFFCLCFRSSRSRYPWFVPFSSSSLCFVLWSLSIYSLSIPLFFFFVSVLCLFFSFFPAVCRLSLWPSLTFIKPEDGLCSCVCASRSWGTNASVSLRRNRGNNLLFWFVLLCSFSPPFSRFLL